MCVCVRLCDVLGQGEVCWRSTTRSVAESAQESVGTLCVRVSREGFDAASAPCPRPVLAAGALCAHRLLLLASE